jgi:TPR repeat protein
VSIFQKKSILHITFIICFLAINPIPQANAADFDKGMEAYAKKDYAAALKELKPLAQQGDAKAQYNLGRIYSARKASSQDQKEAIIWYTKAAEQKDAFSQYTLGQMYAQEKNVAKDYTKSYAWYNLALSQGNETARKGRDNVMMKMTPQQIAEGQELYKQIYNKIYGGK